jgi:iron complex transport system ATP-binding protein
MSAAMIAVEDLAVRAGRTELLDVPRWSVRAGELVGVVGPNGAGKSTLLRTLVGFVRATRGRVETLGRDVAALRGRARAAFRAAIGYVPQHADVSPQMPLTLREVVAIGRTGRAGLFRRLGRQDWEIVDRWIVRLGLADCARRAYADLSGGEQRKALIARALVQEPQLLLLDEPTAHLDLRWREHIVQTLQEIVTAQRLTTVLVCHELEVLPPACARVTLLERGRVAADGPPEEIFTPARVAALYGASVTVRHEHGRHLVVPAPFSGER